jgi:tetratricopeptide (TPR) repeat protein
VAHKVRITRKQIKQDDKFLHAMKEATRKVVVGTGDVPWFERYQKQMLIGLIAVVAVAVLVGGWYAYAAHRAKKAERLMAQADAIYRAPVVTAEQYQKSPLLKAVGAFTDEKKKWSEVVAAYDAVSQAHGGTNSGKLALFYAGNGYYELREYDEAINRYEQYLQKAGADAPFAVLAKQGMGYAYEALNKLDEAQKQFLGLVTEAGGTIAFLSLFDLARIYEKKGDFDQAIETLKKVDSADVAQSPQYFEFKRQAETKIATLEARRGGAS